MRKHFSLSKGRSGEFPIKNLQTGGSNVLYAWLNGEAKQLLDNLEKESDKVYDSVEVTVSYRYVSR